jgi:hypothetical protein
MIVTTNHLAKDLVTKGYLDMSLIVKGMLLPFAYTVIIKTKSRRGGSPPAGMVVKPYQREDLEREIKKRK